jgi:hypothetical protein
MLEQLHPVGAIRVPMEVRTYPRDDEEFRATVLIRLRRFDRVRDLKAIPGRLERLLGEEFPYARARYQDALASTSGTPVLYAFRDGGLVAGLSAAPDGAARPGSEPPRPGIPGTTTGMGTAVAGGPSSGR